MQKIGLATSLPILWGEGDDPREWLASGAPRSWAGDLLAGWGEIQPLDSLVDVQGRLPLPADAMLVMAQPRPLTPQENLALDAWVRGGGRLLLFVDPMLTQPSRYSLGDPRRPQDMAMLSPILAHWGLELQFDPREKSGERLVVLGEASLPVNLPGRFHLLGISGDGTFDRGNGGTEPHSGSLGKSGDAAASCKLESEGILANCGIGAGRVLALADAALFEEPSGRADRLLRRGALTALLSRLRRGD
ncbi:ABC transporter [Novosphingobium sp. BL-8H]|uniref:Gldg family protein n=1 Tax=Novosphingobium sp. BL-8H TaxID=3127640 RepID=UPI003756FCCC